MIEMPVSTLNRPIISHSKYKNSEIKTIAFVTLFSFNFFPYYTYNRTAEYLRKVFTIRIENTTTKNVLYPYHVLINSTYKLLQLFLLVFHTDTKYRNNYDVQRHLTITSDTIGKG